MMSSNRTRQLAFRLPHGLIGRIEECEKHILDAGLNVSRTDVVRLLLTYALNSTKCDLAELLGGTAAKSSAKRKRGKGDDRTGDEA